MRTGVVAMMLAAGLAACAPSVKPLPPRHISSYLLAPDEKPKGTILDAGDSGPQPLDEYVKDDQIKRRALVTAGFVTSYFQVFISEEALRTKKFAPGSVLAISFALEFKTAAGAAQGLAAVKAAVLRDGQNLRERPAPGFGDASFELAGVLEKKRPQPGFIFAWTKDRYVFGLLAVGAPNAVSEAATRELTSIMAAHSNS